MNRQQRRQQARQLAKLAGRADAPRVAGVFTELEGVVDTGAAGRLPPKEEGRHRWIATAGYVLREEFVANELRRQAGEDTPDVILDHESRFSFAIGCYDCEQPFPEIRPGTVCPAGDTDA